jgi:colanic acid/amylovoran biosynthesis glycosyltransferase
MRLVLIAPQFPRLSETFIINKFVGLVEAGWDVHIVCQRLARQDKKQFAHILSRLDLQKRVHQQWRHQPRWWVILLWLPAFLVTFLRTPRLTWRYWRAGLRRSGLKVVKQFYLDATLIGLSPDIIHFEFGALAVGKTYLKQSLGCRLSVSFRGYDMNYAGLEDSDHYAPVWAAADAVHVLGRDLWLKAQQRGCPVDKPHQLIAPAIDLAFFDPYLKEQAADSHATERPLRILSVGRLEWIKGYEYALEAVNIIKDAGINFEYHIIGNGNYLEALSFARYQMGLEEQVQLLGGRSQSDVLAEMNWADVFLHAAVSEGFSNAVLEAQAMKLPVVCSDAGGLPENVVDGVSGFVVPRRNPKALAEKLSLLAGDPRMRRQMGAAGRARVENCFRYEDQIAAFDRFYKEMVVSSAH